MSTTLEGKGTPYANRVAEYAQAAMKDVARYRAALLEIETMCHNYGVVHPFEAKRYRTLQVIAREALRNYGKETC